MPTCKNKHTHNIYFIKYKEKKKKRGRQKNLFWMEKKIIIKKKKKTINFENIHLYTSMASKKANEVL